MTLIHNVFLTRQTIGDVGTILQLVLSYHGGGQKKAQDILNPVYECRIFRLEMCSLCLIRISFFNATCYPGACSQDGAAEGVLSKASFV